MSALITDTDAESASFAGSRVLVTGAAGFIGSRLVTRLLAEGAQVHTLDLLPGAAESVVQAHQADIADADAVAAAVEAADPDHVFHLAAFKERSSTPAAFELAMAVNAGGTLNVLTAAAARPGLRSFVTMGTSEEYGQGPTPFRESQREQPISAYGASKTAATHLCQAFHRARAVPATVLRPTIAYGPGQPPDLFLSALVAALARGDRFPMTPGGQMRDFVHVDDIVEALLLAATRPAARGRVINVGSDEPLTIAELARRVAAQMDAEQLLGIGELPYRTGENMDYRADSTLARELLGWQARVRLEDGLVQVVETARG